MRECCKIRLIYLLAVMPRLCQCMLLCLLRSRDIFICYCPMESQLLFDSDLKTRQGIFHFVTSFSAPASFSKPSLLITPLHPEKLLFNNFDKHFKWLIIILIVWFCQCQLCFCTLQVDFHSVLPGNNHAYVICNLDKLQITAIWVP